MANPMEHELIKSEYSNKKVIDVTDILIIFLFLLINRNTQPL